MFKTCGRGVLVGGEGAARQAAAGSPSPPSAIKQDVRTYLRVWYGWCWRGRSPRRLAEKVRPAEADRQRFRTASAAAAVLATAPGSESGGGVGEVADGLVMEMLAEEMRVVESQGGCGVRCRTGARCEAETISGGVGLRVAP